MAATIKVIKLITNEEIIGVVQDGRDLIEEDDGYTTDNLLFITAPLKIIATYDEKAKAHSLYLIDWIPSIEDDSVPIDKKQVLTLGNPNENLESHYYELILAKELLEQENAAKEEETLSKQKNVLKDTDFDDEDMN